MTAPGEAAIILVVDDDPDAREITSRQLERAGYRTRRAEGGEACLRIVAREPVDLVLLDVMMPGMDGFAVCAALRTAGHRLPIILLTARDDLETRAEGMHHGVSEFLTKPINKLELLARVRAQLHILELNRQLERVERNLRTGHLTRPKPSR